MHVKPVEGREVRDPRSNALLPKEGREVNDGDLFWIRRIRDGDVEVVDERPHAARSRHAQHEPAPAREA